MKAKVAPIVVVILINFLNENFGNTIFVIIPDKITAQM
jgi:hypothetical protein